MLSDDHFDTFCFQIKVFEEGAARASPGGLWAFDMREGGSDKPVRLILVQIQIQTQIQVQIQIQIQIQIQMQIQKQNTQMQILPPCFIL